MDAAPEKILVFKPGNPIELHFKVRKEKSSMDSNFWSFSSRKWGALWLNFKSERQKKPPS
jgi:hypothetical protein